MIAASSLAALSLFVLLCPNEWLGMLVSLPVLAIIGYWLVACRTAGYGDDAVPQEPALAAVPAGSVADTERGRMS